MPEDNKEIETPMDDFIGEQMSSKIINIESIKTKRNIELQNKAGYFIQKYYIEDIFDGKEYNKVVKDIERQVRTSDEYTKYIGYLRGEIGLNRCAILGEVHDDIATIEMHHYPFTLFDVVNIVMAHCLERGEKISTFTMTQKILELHYQNVIGVVPLSKTVHELVHAGEVFVSLDQVFGDVNLFVNTFYLGLNDDYINSLNNLVELTNQGVSYSETDVLRKGKLSWSGLAEGEKKLDFEDV